MRQALSAIGLALVTAVTGSAATLPTGFSESVLATGMTSATAFDIAPDGRVFVCQQGGSLRVVRNGALLATPFLTVTVDSAGERGLLGVAFDPGFVAVGDGASTPNEAQNLDSVFGKILRINPDPANPYPSDNPFPTPPAARHG